MLAQVLFWIVAVIAVLGGIGVVASRQPIRSVLCLVAVMLSLSVLFLMLSAQFVFAVQVIVYAGAVMVLFLFVVALLGPVPDYGQLQIGSMGSLDTTSFLLLAAVLFILGTIGVLVRRNPIVILVCIELMLNAVNLTLITFARQLHNLEGQLFVLMTMVVAAAEAVVGLAVLVDIFRVREVEDVDDLSELRG